MVEAAISTFEDMTLRIADPVASAEQRAGPVRAAAIVRFDGDASGYLVVRVRGPVMGAVTAAMLGMADIPDAAIQQDALGELANVLCGTIVTHHAGSTAEFRLRAPAAGTGVADADNAVQWMHFGVGDGCIEVGIRLVVRLGVRGDEVT